MVYANCTVPETFYSLAHLIDLQEPTNMIPNASRWLGLAASSGRELVKCTNYSI